MKIVFENGDRKIVAEGSSAQAAEFFLDLRGGGWTEDQTALAMEDQRAVMAGETITVNGIDIYQYVDSVNAPEEPIRILCDLAHAVENSREKGRKPIIICSLCDVIEHAATSDTD